MKQTGWSTLLVLTIILTACGSSSTAVVTAATPAFTETAANAEIASDIVIASAKIVPARVSYLSFTISALVKEVAVEAGDSVQDGQTLLVLDTPELEFAVVAADASLRSAQANLVTRNRDKYKYVDGYGRVFYYTVPYEVAQIARAQVQQAQSTLDVAQAILAQSILLSPYEGTVVSVNIIPGELAQAGQTVLTLANLNALQVETTDLSERDVSRLKIGQAVDVFIEALDAHLTGRVMQISPISGVLGGDIVYPITIELNEQPQGLLWGMTAEVEIQTAP